MSIRRVCFVTDEIYPVTAGGIGRLLHNLIQDSLQRDPEIRFHLLVPAHAGIDPARVQAALSERVSIGSVRFRKPNDVLQVGARQYPPPSAFPYGVWQAQSLDFLTALLYLESQDVRFDYIEFPDYRGWAHCALQEKHLGRAFHNTTIAVRLHTSDGVLQRFEPRQLNLEQVGLLDIERKAILDADLVVAHLDPIARFNQECYGFPDSWRDRVVVEFPPVVWPATADVPPPTGERNDFLFVTKLQSVKRPDLFIRAAVALMRRCADFDGRAILACHSFDPGYRAELMKLVPDDLSHRIVFVRGTSVVEREHLLATGIVVIPSTYESLNLTAYEVSAAGAPLIVNGTCLAFGEHSPFRDGVNCHKFDGTVDGLTETMERAWRGPALRAVDWTAQRPYWETRDPNARAARSPVPSSAPRVTVVVTSRDQGLYLPETLSSLADGGDADTEVIVVDNASTSAIDASMLERLDGAEAAAGPVRVIRFPAARGLTAARNAGIRSAAGRYVACIEAGDALAPDFLGRAVRALESNPDYAGVIPTTGIFETDEALASRHFAAYETYLGDAPNLALICDSAGGGAAVFRVSALGSGYEETESGLEDMSLFARLVLAGARFLVTNEVQAYRRRCGNRVSPASAQRLAIIARAFDSLPAPLPASVRLSSLLVLAADEARARGAPRPIQHPGSPQPLRYQLFDSMNDLLKRSPRLHAYLKNRLAGASEEDPRPLRYRIADRVNATIKLAAPAHGILKAVASRARRRRPSA